MRLRLQQPDLPKIVLHLQNRPRFPSHGGQIAQQKHRYVQSIPVAGQAAVSERTRGHLLLIAVDPPRKKRKYACKSAKICRKNRGFRRAVRKPSSGVPRLPALPHLLRLLSQVLPQRIELYAHDRREARVYHSRFSPVLPAVLP